MLKVVLGVNQLISNKLYSSFTILLILSSVMALSEYSYYASAEDSEEDPLAEAGLSLIALRNDTLDTNQRLRRP